MAHTFGNQGALFKNAMTWWDHETDSIWSQPWGIAIDGELKGVELDMIPASVVPWATWLADHPETLVLETIRGAYGLVREGFTSDYVIGVTLGEYAKAYPFAAASREGVINDRLGPFPVVVLADKGTKAVNVYLRRVGEEELEFVSLDGRLVDRQTGRTWDRARGFAVEGPLRGELLKQLPYMTSFDWAWEDFYPHSEFYE